VLWFLYDWQGFISSIVGKKKSQLEGLMAMALFSPREQEGCRVFFKDFVI